MGRRREGAPLGVWQRQATHTRFCRKDEERRHGEQHGGGHDSEDVCSKFHRRGEEAGMLVVDGRVPAALPPGRVVDMRNILLLLGTHDHSRIGFVQETLATVQERAMKELGMKLNIQFLTSYTTCK